MTKAHTMTKARFIGDPNDNFSGPEEHTAFGVVFLKGEWVGVPASAVAKLSGNSHYEIDANSDGQADPDVDEMRARLDALNIAYHHKAGPKKLAELLAGAEG